MTPVKILKSVNGFLGGVRPGCNMFFLTPVKVLTELDKCFLGVEFGVLKMGFTCYAFYWGGLRYTLPRLLLVFDNFGRFLTCRVVKSAPPQLIFTTVSGHLCYKNLRVRFFGFILWKIYTFMTPRRGVN